MTALYGRLHVANVLKQWAASRAALPGAAFSPKRRDAARKMRFAEWGELRAARALRVDAVSVPSASG